jgi:hypothetical protein
MYLSTWSSISEFPRDDGGLPGPDAVEKLESYPMSYGDGLCISYPLIWRERGRMGGMVSMRRSMDGREASSFGSRVATVSAHIVCLASKALETVAIGGTVIAGAVRTRVELGWSGGLSGGCSSANGVGYTGVRWVWRPLAIFLTVGIVWYLGGAALRCGRWVEVGG